MKQAERVIFREEKNPYAPNGKSFLAVFPDEEANPGRINCLPFYCENEITYYAPYCECSCEYYYSTRIVHKGTEEAARCLQAIERYFDGKFTVCEKLTH